MFYTNVIIMKNNKKHSNEIICRILNILLVIHCVILLSFLHEVNGVNTCLSHHEK